MKTMHVKELSPDLTHAKGHWPVNSVNRHCGKFSQSKQVAQRGGRCPIPGNIQAQVGRGSAQPGLVEGVPAHCRGVGIAEL